ncbi:F-box domain [Dillenia turbinata]|uniref:F-box domain n=1 Tax=Dillenia turbinata TaxID=194707 RepID=A0AAN8UR07_9MAGN
METRSAKRKRLLMGEKKLMRDDQSGCDRISDLPDAVLHQILFLLPIKCIAQTSVLSKRWRHIWSTFPDLDFTSTNLIDTSSSMKNSHSHIHPNTSKRFDSDSVLGTDYITQVLALRSKQSYLRTLRFRGRLSFTRLNSLIRCAVRHHVQELDIEVATHDYFNFPRSIIGCDSLRILKLKSRYPGFRLPPSSLLMGGFRTLHTLSLSLVILHDYDQSSLLDFFSDSSFPHLSKLSLDACSGLRHLNIRCKALKELVLEKCYQLISFEIFGEKLERLRVASCFDAYSSKSLVKIDAPHLRIIHWQYNSITDNSSIDTLTCLLEAFIGFFVIHEVINKEKLWSVSNLLSAVSHAHSLVLENQCIEILSNNSQISGVLQNPLNSLKYLEFRTGFNKSSIPGIACLFKNSPSLHSLTIKIVNDYKTERRQWTRDLWDLSSSMEERYWESQIQLLKSFLHHLKVVKIHGFSECENEVSLAKFLLRHGKVLEEMILCSGHCNSRDSLRLEKVKSQMMGFSRASSNAKITYY